MHIQSGAEAIHDSHKHLLAAVASEDAGIRESPLRTHSNLRAVQSVVSDSVLGHTRVRAAGLQCVSRPSSAPRPPIRNISHLYLLFILHCAPWRMGTRVNAFVVQTISPEWLIANYRIS